MKDDEATQSTLELIEQMKEGDENAVNRLYELYAGKLIGVVQKSISAKFGGRFTSESVVQSAIFSMIKRTNLGQFRFADDEAFWKLLISIALNKLRKKVEFHQAEKRDPGREISAEVYVAERLKQPNHFEDGIHFKDTLDQLLNKLDKRSQDIILAKMEGKTQQEIADELDVNEKTIRRAMTKIRDAAAKLFDFDYVKPAVSLDEI